MKYVLKSVDNVPPGGWRWRCPTHGVTVNADFFPELLRKVTNYQRANKMEVADDPIAWLQDATCRQNEWGPETCRPVADKNDL